MKHRDSSNHQFGATLQIGSSGNHISIHKNKTTVSTAIKLKGYNMSNSRKFLYIPSKKANPRFHPAHPLPKLPLSLCLILFFSLMFLTGGIVTSCKQHSFHSEKHSPSTTFTAEKLIPQSFIRTCLNCGFDNLNIWQQFNRILWNLDYIAWEAEAEVLTAILPKSPEPPEYFGIWEENNGKSGEIHLISEKQQAPYFIEGSIHNDDSTRFNYSITNKSAETITSFNIVFFLFDDDGNPPETDRNIFSYEQNQFILPGETLEDFIDLRDFHFESEFFADYIYLSRIEYKSGSVWTDPLGRKYFN